METGRLEHVNITVSDPDRTMDWLQKVFSWKLRWRGDAIHGGHTIHVGTDSQYLAIYSGPGGALSKADNSYAKAGGLNHVAIVVDDIEAAEARVKQVGFTPKSHADYEPGRRFYFDDHDGIEFEVVSYS